MSRPEPREAEPTRGMLLHFSRGGGAGLTAAHAVRRAVSAGRQSTVRCCCTNSMKSPELDHRSPFTVTVGVAMDALPGW